MEDIKLYGLSAFALMTSMSSINPILQTVVLGLTIIYTIIKIYQRLNNNDNESS
jgi:hypothetical protein